MTQETLKTDDKYLQHYTSKIQANTGNVLDITLHKFSVNNLDLLKSALKENSSVKEISISSIGSFSNIEFLAWLSCLSSISSLETLTLKGFEIGTYVKNHPQNQRAFGNMLNALPNLKKVNIRSSFLVDDIFELAMLVLQYSPTVECISSDAVLPESLFENIREFNWEAWRDEKIVLNEFIVQDFLGLLHNNTTIKELEGFELTQKMKDYLARNKVISEIIPEIETEKLTTIKQEMQANDSFLSLLPNNKGQLGKDVLTEAKKEFLPTYVHRTLGAFYQTYPNLDPSDLANLKSLLGGSDTDSPITGTDSIADKSQHKMQPKAI